MLSVNPAPPFAACWELRVDQTIVFESTKYCYWLLTRSPLSIGNILDDWFLRHHAAAETEAKKGPKPFGNPPWAIFERFWTNMCEYWAIMRHFCVFMWGLGGSGGQQANLQWVEKIGPWTMECRPPRRVTVAVSIGIYGYGAPSQPTKYMEYIGIVLLQ